MIAVTSKIAYKQLNEEGIGKTQKEKIMYVIKEHYNIHNKGLSNNDIMLLTGFTINAVSGRVNDLKKDRLLEVSDKKKCPQTKRLVNTVIPKDEDVFIEEELDKLKLLLNLYGYESAKIQQPDKKDSKPYVMYKHWQQIFPKDLENIRINSNIKLEEQSWYDDDQGYLFYYDINIII
jgi:hypothetical protein